MKDEGGRIKDEGRGMPPAAASLIHPSSFILHPYFSNHPYRSLMIATAGLWLIVLGPVVALSGRRGVEDVSIFAIACLFPGWLVFWLVSRYRVAKSQAFAILSGTAFRVVFAGAAFCTITLWRGGVENDSLLWLAVFYVATLMMETLLILGRDTQTVTRHLTRPVTQNDQ